MEIGRAFKVVASNLDYSLMKEEQLNIVRSFVEGNDVFAVLPTSYGKTLCFASLPEETPLPVFPGVRNVRFTTQADNCHGQ